MADAKGSRVLKAGCTGCATVLVLGGVGLAAIGVIGWQSARSEQVETRSVARELDVARDGPPEDTPGPFGASAPGRVVLAIEETAVRVRPASPGEPLSVDATFDTRAYRFEHGFRPTDIAPWEYRVELDRTASTATSIFRELFGGSRAEVEVRVPTDTPFILVVEGARGEWDVELGGTTVTALDARVRQGGLAVGFDRPTERPLDSIALDVSMGGVAFRGVGNASPALLEANVRMGGVAFDLSGPWARDLDARLRLRMAGGEVVAPRSVRLVAPGHAAPERPGRAEVPAPVLRFEVDVEMGEIEFRRF